MDNYLHNLVLELTRLPKETEWVEFKHNYVDPQEIGEYLSALSNAAALHGKQSAYIIWGIEDETHNILGTDFKPMQAKKGNEELCNWLATQINPRIDFKVHEINFSGYPIVIFEIPRAINKPIRFKGTSYIRYGSYKKKLIEHPDKEAQLWKIFGQQQFEVIIAKENVLESDVLSLINYPSYFDLTKQPLPDNREGIIEKLVSEKFLVPKSGNMYDITNLGAMLFAKQLTSFDQLSRKAIRIVVYQAINRVNTVREYVVDKGYAIGLEEALRFIDDQLPQNEVIEQALRKQEKMYPDIAIREIVANAIIHQDFTLSGTGPIIEVFSDRMEVTNPGVPLIDTLRFIDEPPQSRNEMLASFMRRINLCEERGSGIDKVIFHIELFQLPAPDFIVTTNHTKAVLFSYRDMTSMDKEDRVRACYQHACLLYVSNSRMTNATLRTRFNISQGNYPIASRIISDTIAAELIKRHDPDNASKRHAKYVPFWT